MRGTTYTGQSRQEAPHPYLTFYANELLLGALTGLRVREVTAEPILPPQLSPPALDTISGHFLCSWDTHAR